MIGPALPSAMGVSRYEDDDDDDDVGPRPLPAGYVVEEKDGVQEFLEREERRRKRERRKREVEEKGVEE